MVLNEFIWECIKLCAGIWMHMMVYGRLFAHMDVYEGIWWYMNINGNKSMYVKVCEALRWYMNANESVWMYMSNMIVYESKR